MAAVRDVYHETAGEGDLRCDPWSLGADRLLGDLDQDFLSTLDLVLDRRVPAGTATAALTPAPIRPRNDRRLGGPGAL